MSIIPKESNNTNSLALIHSPQTAEPNLPKSISSINNLSNELNLVDDTCQCIYCQAIYIIYLGPIAIPITQGYLNEVWFKDSYLFNRLRNQVSNVVSYGNSIAT